MLQYAHAALLEEQCKWNQTMKNLDWGKSVFLGKKLTEIGLFSEKLKTKYVNNKDKVSQNYRHTQRRHKIIDECFK